LLRSKTCSSVVQKISGRIFRQKCGNSPDLSKGVSQNGIPEFDSWVVSHLVRSLLLGWSATRESAQLRGFFLPSVSKAPGFGRTQIRLDEKAVGALSARYQAPPAVAANAVRTAALAGGGETEIGEARLRRILCAYAAYYNQARTHLALQKDAPLRRAVQRSGAIVATPILAGLHHQYVRI